MPNDDVAERRRLTLRLTPKGRAALHELTLERSRELGERLTYNAVVEALILEEAHRASRETSK